MDKIFQIVTATHSSSSSTTGTVSATNDGYSSYQPFMAFDKDDSTFSAMNGNVPCIDYFIEYDFVKNVDIYCIKTRLTSNKNGITNMKYKVNINDELIDIENSSISLNWDNLSHDFKSKSVLKNVKSIKLICSDTSGYISVFGSYGMLAHEIKLYGRV